MTLVRQDAPHLRTKRSTFAIMMELTAALLVIYVAAVCYNFIGRHDVMYGVHALVIGVLAVGVSVLCDFIYYIPYALGKKTLKSHPDRRAAYFYKVSHSYSYVSGLILALLLPVGTAFYTVIVSALVGTLLAKLLFGGFGYNTFNPAIIGRVFAQVCFGSTLKTYIGSAAPESVETGASITTSLSQAGWITTDYGLSLGDTLLGNYAGTLGETFAFLIVILGVYLAIRKIIDWRITVTYVLSLFCVCLLMGAVAGLGVDTFEWAFRQILIGGILFGAVFCLTDPVTSPTAPTGKIIYALLAALVTAVIRYQASAAEGVAYSILIVNLATPAIDRLISGKTDSKQWPKFTAMGVLFVGTLIFGLVFGLNHKVETKQTAERPTVQTVAAPDLTLPADLYLEGGC